MGRKSYRRSVVALPAVVSTGVLAAGCGGSSSHSSSGPRYTAENQKAKIEQKLVADETQVDNEKAIFPSAGEVTASCVAQTSTTLAAR